MIVIPARVVVAGNEPGGAVVGNHHAVFLEGSQDHLHVGWISRYIETGFQAETLAHRRILRACQDGSVVTRRPNICVKSLRYREPYGVPDFTRQYFLVAGQ